MKRCKLLFSLLIFTSLLVLVFTSCNDSTGVSNENGGSGEGWLSDKELSLGFPAPSELIHQIQIEQNRVRTNPVKYAKEILKPRLAFFDGNMYKEPGKVPLITREGAAAVQECIEALLSTEAMSPLSLEKGLCLSSQWLANDQATTGKIGHVGSDGSTFGERMNNYGTWSITAAENCSYGLKIARDIVSQLLIDDGVTSRGHRKNILNSKLKVVGIGYSDKNNAPYGAVTVLDYAGAYISN